MIHLFCLCHQFLFFLSFTLYSWCLLPYPPSYHFYHDLLSSESEVCFFFSLQFFFMVFIIVFFPFILSLCQTRQHLHLHHYKSIFIYTITKNITIPNQRNKILIWSFFKKPSNDFALDNKMMTCICFNNITECMCVCVHLLWIPFTREESEEHVFIF